MSDLVKVIEDYIEREPNNPDHYEALLSIAIENEDLDLNDTVWRRTLEKITENGSKGDYDKAKRFDDLTYKSVLFGAKERFECFCMAIDYNKEPDKRFYLPRRHYLKPIVDAYQEVADGKLHFLSISMPKRSGKSQTGILFNAWMMGRFPDKSILCEGTGDALVTSFYKGILEYILPPNDYNYYEVFPTRRLIQSDAKMLSLNLDSKSRFPTFMARSIDSRQVGLSEANNILYLDDLVEGREEAKNRQRLNDKWEILSGDVLGRAIEGTPIIVCGTRYSIYDPIGHLQEEAKQHGWSWKAIEIPALDFETDESNYEYIRDGKRIFTTQFFREQRDMLSAEQFESEFQQVPFEAKGVLFEKDKLNYFFELPVDIDPDAVVAACDTADKGADFCSMPVALLYGEDVFINDVVFDDAPPLMTKPEIAKALINNRVQEVTFESNNAGSYYARDIQDILKSKGFNCSIRTKRTVSNKETRIEFASDVIIKNFWFKHPSTYARNSQYAEFMRNLCAYTRTGKNPHDDAPDSLAMLQNAIAQRQSAKVEIFQRPF